MTTTQQNLRCGVIGVGYLGSFHAQKYAQLSNATLVAVCDIHSEHVQAQASIFQTAGYSDYRQLAGKVDAVSIATPTANHFEIAAFCLEHGIHVLLEKPMTETQEQAQQLIELAKQHQCILQIGHIERYNSAIQTLKPMLNKPRYIESTRQAAFKTRGTDVNVVFDMMIHDIDIIQSLVDSPISEITAHGMSVLSKFIDFSNARLSFENGTVANVTASRVSLKSERSLRLFQHDAYHALDLHERLIATYRKQHSEHTTGVSEMLKEEQRLPQNDALLDQIQDFLHNIRTHQTPLVDGVAGLQALRTAITITKIMRSKDWNYHAQLTQQPKKSTS